MSKDFKVKNGLQVTTHITASGNISGSLTSTGSFGNIIGTSISLPNDSIPIAQLASDAITIAGSSTALGGSITADTIAGQISADTISGNQINGGTIGSTTITALAGALSLGDNNITNVGDINCDSISIDAAGTGLDIVFGGNTTKNKITLTDNLADALNITEGSNSYIKFTTTNSSEKILVSQDTEFLGDASGSLTSTASFGHFIGNGGGLTGVTTTVDIDGFDAFSGVPHATQDEFLISDNGTEKRATMTMVANGGFALVSGDATIAAGGALTIAADSVQGTMLNDDVADDSTIEISSNNLSVLKVPEALTAGAGILAAGTFDGAAARTFSVDSASFAPFFSASMNDFTTAGTGSFGYATAAEISASSIILPNDAISGDVVSGGTIGTTTITALAGNLSLGDNNITNVGDINADSISVDAAGTGLNIDFGGNTTKNKISLTDNLADALNITQGSNSYMKFTTTNSGEEIKITKKVALQNVHLSGSGASTGSFAHIIGTSISLPNDSIPIAQLASDAITIAGTSTALGGSITADTIAGQISADEISGNQINGGTIGSITISALAGALSLGDNNITNVGDINADSISVDAAGTGLNVDFSGGNTTKNLITLGDNLADALNITEGSNSYMKFTTTNSGEEIKITKKVALTGVHLSGSGASTGSFGHIIGTSISLPNDSIPIAQLASDAITIAGSSTALGGSITADTIAGQISADTISGNQINGGTIGSVTITALAGALSLGDNNITNVGDINADSISVDAAGTGLDIVFGGNTTKNKITLTDNLADALNITEGSNSYMKFTTTNSGEEIKITQKVALQNVHLSGSGASTGSFGRLEGDGGGLTNVSADIDSLDALGGTGLHQTQDKFMFSDNGTEKSITFSNLEDAIFGNVSGDATVAAGGALTIAANSVEGTMLNTNAADTSTMELSSDSLSVLKVPNALTAGTGLNNGGGTFDGAAARTFSVDSASFAPFFSASMNNFTTAGTASFGGDVSASGILKGISVSTPGTVTAGSITLTGLSNQGSEATAVMINGSDVVGTRELGSNAFTSTTIGTTTNALTAGAGILAAGTFNGAAARTFSIDSASFAPFFSASMNDFTTAGTGSFGGDISASGVIRGIGLDINGAADFGDNNITNVGTIDVDTIRCDGDTNTNIALTTDTITFTADGIEMLKLVESVANSVTINEGAADVNLRVESSNKTHMLFVDAGNDTVGIDNTAPPQALTVTGNISASGEIEVPHRFFDTGSTALGTTAGNVQGDIVKFGGTTTVAGAIYQLKSGGVWAQTDADAAATATGSIAVAMGTNSTTNGMCLRGVVNLNHDPGGGAGAPIYLAVAAGSSSNAAPSGNNDIARIIGYNLADSAQIYFNPDNTYVEVTA